MKGKKVFLRRLTGDDFAELTDLNKSSKDFHKGLANPPKDRKSFDKYLARNKNPNDELFVICLNKDNAIAGAISLSQIVRGGFQSCFMGYYLGEQHSGKGLITEAIKLIMNFAFKELKLHRIEANIQPHNLPSIAVVKKNGFVKEGFSKNYLRVDGKWCDHERWAIIFEDWKKENEN